MSVRLSDEDCEALVDELMALVDFGQTINEPTVQIASERCLRLIMLNTEVEGVRK